MMAFQTEDKNRLMVGKWLLVMAFLVLIMVMVGGATRLTESGLSMTTWKPVTGVIPPITEADWQAEFQLYQQSPEYKLKNFHMTVPEFKNIFYWEWGHRVLGRIIGLMFALPLLYFWLKKAIPTGYKPRLLVLLFLGGMQGVLGWVMVKSGLKQEPAVSHYLLTAHLSTALFLLSVILWQAFNLLYPKPSETRPDVRKLSYALMGLLVLQIIMGALVAGMKAGHIFNTWPLMGDGFVPDGLLLIDPLWRNFIDNATTLQFEHRLGAYALAILVGVLFWKTRNRISKNIRRASTFVTLAVGAQIAIGIVMLLLHVPVSWGTLHQGFGAIVLAFMVYLLHLQRTKNAL